MSVTREVSRCERSREASEEQPANIPLILVTCEVSRCERSREGSAEQPENMLPMLVTREVSRPERSRVSASCRPSKRWLESSGAETPPSTTTDLTAFRRSPSPGNASYMLYMLAISPDTPSVGRMVSLPESSSV